MNALSRLAACVGALSLATPALAQEAPDVLVLGSVSTWVYNFDVENSLMLDGRLGRIETYEIGETTPVAEDLDGFDVVFIYGDQPYHDPERLGDLLADFVDAGGGVVVAGQSFDAATAPAGRLVSSNYLPFTTNGTFSGAVGDMRLELAPIPERVHEVLLNVAWFYGGTGSFHSTGIGATPGPFVKVVANWENGQPLVAVNEVGAGRTVGLNFFPPSNLFAPQYPQAAEFWRLAHHPEGGDPVAMTHGAQLMASSIIWAAGINNTCYNTVMLQDYNCNGVDERLEGDIDETAPECDQNPQPNQDWYYDYATYGCEFEVSGNDQDGDGLGDQPQQIYSDGSFPVLVFEGPTCDNCPNVSNIDQRNIECDGAGDLCDGCPTLEDNGMNSDGDDWADACDVCAGAPDNDQADGDYDLSGDACDNCNGLYNPLQEDGGDEGIEAALTGFPDGVGNACDNCPNDLNPAQLDLDGDNVGDVCDNCPNVPNFDQIDFDGDGLGDACDPCPLLGIIDPKDSDQDGVGDDCDICMLVVNPLQLDVDEDGIGDKCDNCPLVANNQLDIDADGVGDPCDLCPNISDPEQLDDDGDGLGNLCDGCPTVPDPFQEDIDGDGIGDVCDVCVGQFNPNQEDLDDDGVGDLCDNCPSIRNPRRDVGGGVFEQLDDDGDGIGNECDYQVRGGGATFLRCTTGVGSGTAGWFTLFAGALLLRRRR